MDNKIETIALVTGATDGIGKEVARQLAQKGLTVVVGARNLEKGGSVIEAFKKDGLELDLVQLDITDPESVANAVKELDAKYGRLDVLVNNAGMALDRGPVSEMGMEDFTATFETNVFGTFRATRSFLPLIKKSDHGRIVIVSSGLASMLNMTNPESTYYNVRLPSYAASKAALNVLTVHMAVELEPHGIKINAVEPGLTATRYVSLDGAQTVEQGAEAPVRYALIDEEGPTGGFFDRFGVHNW